MRGHGLTIAGLVAVVVLAAGVRTIGAEYVFVGDGDVVLLLDDSQYHARRALFTFVNFPSALTRDTYLAYPHGAHVPWPPGYDWALGAVARLFGDEPHVLDLVLAWTPVALGVANTLLVYVLARAFASPWVGLLAAAIYALLPATARYSALGNPDHHAAVAVLGTALLVLYAGSLRASARTWALVARGIGIVLVLAAVSLTWHGSLLYLVLGQGAFMVSAALAGQRRALVSCAAGGLATAALLAAFVVANPPGLGGPFSSIELSWLHVYALAASAILAGALALWDLARPVEPVRVRVQRVAVASAVVAVVALLTPGVWKGLTWGLEYVGKSDSWIADNFENQPLFPLGPAAQAIAHFGGIGLLLPLTPLAFLMRLRDSRVFAAATMTAAWSAVMAYLAISQNRYGNDLAPTAAVGFALLLAALSGSLSRLGLSTRNSRAAAIGLTIALLALPISEHVRGARSTMAWLIGRTHRVGLANATMQGTVYQFAKSVRAATPETEGFLDPTGTPEYGIVSFPLIGHSIQNLARRPTTADTFGPYLGGTNLLNTARFYFLESEEVAVRVAAKWGVRYVVTAEEGGEIPVAAILHRLHRNDGCDADEALRLKRFRLVTEGPRGGVSIGAIMNAPGARGVAPYKLFEIVKGALLVMRAAPGTEVAASVVVTTPARRRFTYRAMGRANARGVARLRVPYATVTDAPARPTTPYLVRVGDTTHVVAVTDAEVRAGSMIEVGDTESGD